MHGIIPRLAPLMLDHFGLADALDDLVERTKRSQPELQIDKQIEPGATHLSGEAALTVYRAAQEGLTNALRHGHAGRLQLALRGGDQEVTLTVTDDGQGLPPDWAQRAGHYGLRWLAERAQALHGRLDLEPAAPRGVMLRLCLPAPAP
jgi:two-component system sensor histidine kinase UhpB